MRRIVGRFVRSQAFNPRLLGAFVNPFFLARRALWAAMVDLAPAAGGRLLDVGCGSQPYRSLFSVDSYVGLEIDSDESRARGIADAYYEGDVFPFDEASFDTVLCNQVLEHVFDADRFCAEMCRVLVPGGLLVLTVPFVWDEHEQPNDFARYSSFGLRALLKRNGFRIIEQRKLLSDSSVLCQLVNAYLFKVFARRTPVAQLLVTASLMAPISLAGLALSRVLPANPDLFLDQVVVAQRA